MNRWALCCVLSIGVLGAVIHGNSSVVRAGDGGQSGGDQKGSKPVTAGHPTGDSMRGEELYNASCVVCHGQGASGGIGPKLAGNPVLSNDQAFWKTVHEGRHVMPPLKGVVTEQQLADIRAWLKTLR